MSTEELSAPILRNRIDHFKSELFQQEDENSKPRELSRSRVNNI